MDYKRELVSIIELVVSKLTDDSDMMWTTYNSVGELRQELTRYIVELESDDGITLKKLYVHFLPTSTFQEHSLNNGWGEEYIKIATEFDRLYNKIKN